MNRLSREKSPYLLQHAHNPVDWYPWGDEAFARARSEEKPIFLSVGYSTCHWCHVMERESFEDEETAKLMNARFVSVKVDREERPDVDDVYMAYVQATTGQGGWPMSVFLTPSLEPFYGGTYFPPAPHYGRPSFRQVLESVARAWDERRDEIRAQGARVVRALSSAMTDAGPPQLLDRTLLHAAVATFRRSFDRAVPGFGDAPRFPRTSVFDFLFRAWHRLDDTSAAQMPLAVLGTMARGGVHDHLGGGFHRYSVDREWHVPHFEKMLYDQAQIVVSLVEALQIAPNPEMERVARSTLAYALRDLRDKNTGAFYCGEDADSPVSPGSKQRAEGAFYVFTKDEIDAVLGDASDVFCAHYGVAAEGNAEDPHGELAGKNVLHRSMSFADTAARAGASEDEVRRILSDARDRLLAYRDARPRPHLDDKVLTAWNGLMLTALARAHQVLGDREYLDAAVRVATFLSDKMWRRDEKRVMRRFRDGEVACAGVLEDYAFFAEGLVDLYEASLDRPWLALAEQVVDAMVERFHDGEGGAFWSTAGDDPSILVRLKDDYDGAEPAGNSVAALVCARLGYALDRRDLVAKAEGTVRHFSARLAAEPQVLPEMLVAFDLLLDGPAQVVIAGEKDDAATQQLLAALHKKFAPRKVVLLADEATRREWGARLGHLAGMTPHDGKPAAYVCRDWACERPTTDPAELATRIGGRTLGAPGS